LTLRRPAAVPVTSNGTWRWFMSTAWVAAPGAIRTAFAAAGFAGSVPMSKPCPGWIDVGALTRSGRGASESPSNR
jgi:hypothetical protein